MEAKEAAPRMEADIQRASRWEEESVVEGEGRERKWERRAVAWYQWKAREDCCDADGGEGERWVSWRRERRRKKW
jgi:hypothetical protein